MSLKTLLFAVGALALAACADPTEPGTVDAPAMLVRPPLPIVRPERIAFASGGDASSEIYVMNPNGSGIVRLTTNPSYDGEPAFSPEGSRIAFTSRRSGNYEVWVMTANTSGTGLVNVSRDAGWDGEAAWSPDGSKIAFASNRDGNYRVYVVYADGSGLVRGFMPPFGREPVWSPDGSKIAFRRQGEIYVMNATSGSVTANLTTNSSQDEEPAWSPDGSKIAFTSDRDGVNGDIYVMNATSGSVIARLTTYGGFDGEPAWSPDGSQIAFTSDRDGTLEIYVVSATNGETGGTVRLTGTSVLDREPTWGLAPFTNAP